MKNIYDIFEQRKIDSIKCDFNNIMESMSEFDYMVNILENECYNQLEEAFDFGKMKERVKKGAKTAVKGIKKALDATLDFLRELWKKVRVWFKNIKNYLLKKEDIEDIVEKIVEAAMEEIEDKNDDNVNKDDNAVDFGEWVDNLSKELEELRKQEKEAETPEESERIEKKIVKVRAEIAKKKVSDAERKYRQQRSEQRLKREGRVPSLSEIVHRMGSMRFKTTKITPYDKLKRNFSVLNTEMRDFIRDFYRENEDNISYDIYEYLHKLDKRAFPEPNESGLKFSLLHHDNEEQEMSLNDVGNALLSYSNTVDDMVKFMNECESILNKTFDKVVKQLERAIKDEEGTVYQEVEIRTLSALRKAMPAVLNAHNVLVAAYNSEHSKAKSIILRATDRYINEVIKK
jgi:hypothetical protein